MSPFEYIVVLISIILGLGITIILTGVAELIKRWNTTNHFWPYLIWIAVVFVLHIQEWWATYELRLIKSWSLPVFLFVILYPILLFILANLLFPAKWSAKGVDIKEFYFLNCRKFFFCIVIFALISIIQNIHLVGYSYKEQTIQFCVFVVFTIMLFRPTRNVYVHAFLSFVMLAIMIAGLFLTKNLME